jgi:hypothetical protein
MCLQTINDHENSNIEGTGYQIVKKIENTESYIPAFAGKKITTKKYLSDVFSPVKIGEEKEAVGHNIERKEKGVIYPAGFHIVTNFEDVMSVMLMCPRHHLLKLVKVSWRHQLVKGYVNFTKEKHLPVEAPVVVAKYRTILEEIDTDQQKG